MLFSVPMYKLENLFHLVVCLCMLYFLFLLSNDGIAINVCDHSAKYLVHWKYCRCRVDDLQ